LSKQGDDLYRWIDTPAPLATTGPEKPLGDIKREDAPAPPKVAANGSQPTKKPEIVYQVIVRHAGEPTRVIIDELVSRYQFAEKSVGTYFGILSRGARIRHDQHGNWIPTQQSSM
jgi:hypothetical protein